MNKEHVNGGRHGMSDTDLRSVYRGLAVEGSPPDLDARILGMAQAQLDRQGRRARRWYSPLALAATVALCVALVVDLGMDPDSTVGTVAEPASAEGDSIHNAAIESRARKMSESKTVKSGQPTAPAAEPAASFAPAPVPDARRETAAPASASETATGFSYSFSDEALEELTVTGQLADRAAMRQTAGCAVDVTRRPEPWLECIRQLEEAGLAALSRQERERFDVAYPDYVPAAD